MKPPVTVAVVGYGYWGPNLARNFGSQPGVELTAVCDADDERRHRASQRFPGLPVFRDAAEMVATVKPDALAIATPAATHVPLARMALEAGCDVLVEKPMALSAAECRELNTLAAERGRILMVGHTYLFSDAVQEILRIIRGGGIGEVRYVNCQRLNLGLFQPDINVVWDLAPHDLSIILEVMGGPPETVNCQGNAHVAREVEDVGNLSLRFSGNRFATVQCSWLEPRKVRQMTFVGTRGMIVFDDLEARDKIRIYDVRVECPPHYDNFGEFPYAYHYGDCRIPRIEQREPLAAMCDHFSRCVLERRTPNTCGERGADVVAVLEACQRSLRSDGAPVKLEPGGGIRPTALRSVS